MPPKPEKRETSANVPGAHTRGCGGQGTPEGAAPIPDSLLRKRYWKYNSAFLSTHSIAAAVMTFLTVYEALNGMLSVALMVLALLILLLISPDDEFARMAYRSLDDLLHRRCEYRTVTLERIDRIVYRWNSHGWNVHDLMRLRLWDSFGNCYICCLDRNARFLYTEWSGTMELNVAYMAKSHLVLSLSIPDPRPKEVKAQYRLTILSPLLDEYRTERFACAETKNTAKTTHQKGN